MTHGVSSPDTAARDLIYCEYERFVDMSAICTAIDQMSTAEKVQTMEYLWTALSSHYADETPAWHAAVLAERANAPDSEFEDWESVKAELRNANSVR